MRVLSHSRLGFRGAVLLILATVDLLYGWSLLHPTAEQLRTSAFEFRSHLLPTEAFGVMWMTVGVVLIFQALADNDRVGYTIAITIKVVWAFIAFASFVTGKVQQGWVSCAIWMAVAAMAMVISGWPEPLHSTTVTTMQDDLDKDDQ